MKKLTIITLALMSVLPLNAQWNTINSGTDKNLTSLSFADNDNGAIAGEDGLVLFTDDGGATWTERSICGDFPPDLNDVCMVSSTTAWVVGSSGKIFKTSDAGATWTEQFWDASLNPYRLYSVFFIDENKGWATGMSGNVIYTTDGGETPWQEQSTFECFYWNRSIFFLDENNGWVAGQYETIDKTTDGGQNWTGLNTATDPGICINDIFFVDENNGWLAGTYGEVWNTNDGGSTWNSTQPSQYDLYAVYFVNQNQGYTVGQEGRICISMNGGQTWMTYWDVTIEETLTDVHFFDENNGIVVGYAGTILSTTNNGGMSVQDNELKNNTSIYPNPSSGLICFEVPEESNIEISDLQGRKIIASVIPDGLNSFDFTDLAKGTYIAIIKNDRGVVTEKIILK